jgi:hypothetical protein
MKKHLITAAWGGGVGGLLDILYAVLLWGVFLKLGAVTILQSVAQGLIGTATYHGGAATAALGLALHFFIAYVMALVYIAASVRLPALNAHPWIYGALYGVVLFVVMNFVVVPLSAIGPRPMTLVGAIRGLLPHVLFVGPAIAVFTARRAQLPGGS